MKFSEHWLRTWVDPKLSTEQLTDLLTMSGLEVDSIEAVAGHFSGVIVGEVIHTEPHPNADKLTLCQVSDGQEHFQVVCGAPNVRAGIKVPFAKIGAKLGEDFTIKKAKLRQVESFGMLCSEKELGISDADEGLMELPNSLETGQDLRHSLQLDDLCIEVDLTPNRADCISIMGIARDLGSLSQTPVTPIEVKSTPDSHSETLSIDVKDQQSCPRFLGRILKGIDLNKPTPTWMSERLRRSGLRAINPVVDVTNYVMLEMGQPMHAYDLRQIQGGIVVRKAHKGEKLTLLDGSELDLDTESLLIADHEKALGLAGIMGGLHSGVSNETGDLYLEVAFFQPTAIAGKARHYGLHTDASYRFERGVDFNLQQQAMERATELLLAICGGQAGPINEALSESYLPKRHQIELRHDRLEKLLGLTIDDHKVTDILTRLEFQPMKTTDSWSCQAPSFRYDIALEVDLIEEVARVNGYDQLPARTDLGQAHLKRHKENTLSLSTLKHQLVAEGFQEAITYSFVDPKTQALLNPNIEPISLLNPISSEMSVMRTNLWSGLLQALIHNLNRQQTRVALFETGLRFEKAACEEQLPKQTPVLAAAITGDHLPKTWANPHKAVDFFDLKGVIERLMDLGLSNQTLVSFEPSNHPALHPGQAANIRVGGETVGVIGAIHPRVQKDLGLKQPVYVFEVEQEHLLMRKVSEFKALSKFPEVQRDLAFTVPVKQKAADLEELIRRNAGDYLLNVRLFDLYQGEGIDPQRKSIALGLTWQHPSRTLNDEEINSWMTAIINSLQQEVDAQLRG